MTTGDSDIAGVLLAGGLSRRMGGGDKGLLRFGDGTMLGHVIARFAPQVGRLVLNANGDPARFAAFDLPVVADTIDGNVGPLAGVLAGMRWAREHTHATFVATTSTDAPFLPRDLVVRLRQVAQVNPGGIAIARSGGHLHPVIGLWPVALHDDLDAALKDDGIRKVLRWTDRHGTLPVDFADLEIDGKTIDPFFNANTPDELDEARRLIES
ncbi:MAG: molybdenum cofactor guanylyltransferase MobA [Hyphomicrobiaceae bacterium]